MTLKYKFKMSGVEGELIDGGIINILHTPQTDWLSLDLDGYPDSEPFTFSINLLEEKTIILSETIEGAVLHPLITLQVSEQGGLKINTPYELRILNDKYTDYWRIEIKR